MNIQTQLKNSFTKWSNLKIQRNNSEFGSREFKTLTCRMNDARKDYETFKDIDSETLGNGYLPTSDFKYGITRYETLDDSIQSQIKFVEFSGCKSNLYYIPLVGIAATLRDAVNHLN